MKWQYFLGEEHHVGQGKQRQLPYGQLAHGFNRRCKSILEKMPLPRVGVTGVGCSKRLVRQGYRRLGSELDFNINAAGQVKLHQGVDGLCRRAVDIDDAPMGAGFEVLA